MSYYYYYYHYHHHHHFYYSIRLNIKPTRQNVGK